MNHLCNTYDTKQASRWRVGHRSNRGLNSISVRLIVAPMQLRLFIVRQMNCHSAQLLNIPSHTGCLSSRQRCRYVFVAVYQQRRHHLDHVIHPHHSLEFEHANAVNVHCHCSPALASTHVLADMRTRLRFWPNLPIIKSTDQQKAAGLMAASNAVTVLAVHDGEHPRGRVMCDSE